MEELTIEEMTSLKGGQDTNFGNQSATAYNNSATAIAGAANVNMLSVGSVTQSAEAEAKALAGNIIQRIRV